MTTNAMTAYSRAFEGKAATAQLVETARGQWKQEMEHVWGGAGGWVHCAADWLQTAAGAAILGSAPAITIPVVGEVLEGFEGVTYAFASAVKGLVRTSAENRAIDKAGGSKNDHGGVGRTVGNILKSALPFFDVK